MEDWIWSGAIAVLIGALAFFLCFITLLAWHQRVAGRPSFARIAGAAATSAYAVALVSYTMLPLPQIYPGWCSDIRDKSPQFVPFYFVEVVAGETAGSGFLAILSNYYALQVLFNVLLFVPWGIIATRYFGQRVLGATVSGFLASLVIESTQYTGLWGQYECAYRLADVDDLLANTTGALLGALLAPLLLRWLPKRGGLTERQQLPRPVSSWRRWWGMLLDYSLFMMLIYLLVSAAALTLWLLGVEAPNQKNSSIIASLFQADRAPSPIFAGGAVLAGLLVFYLPAWFGSGASLGQRILRLRPSWPRQSLARRVYRATVSGGLLTAATVLAALFSTAVWSLLIQALIFLVLLLSVILVPFSRGKRGLSFALSGAELVDERS